MEPVPAPQTPSPSDISSVEHVTPPQPTKEDTSPQDKSQHSLNPMLLAITILAVIIAIGSLFYTYTVTQRYQSQLLSNTQSPTESPAPEVTTSLGSTVVSAYKPVTFEVMEIKKSSTQIQPVQIQLSIPETWTYSETSKTFEEGYEQGWKSITIEIRAGDNAVLRINNLMDSGGAMPSALPEGAVSIANLTNRIPKESVVPCAVYRIYDEKRGVYDYFTAEKGKYSYLYGTEEEIRDDGEGWHATFNFLDLAYYKNFDSMAVITVALTYTGSPENKDEFLALFDKVMQSLEVL